MINLSQKNVVKIAKETNFIKDNVEKVMRLADILEFVFTSKWKEKLVLKGGTAINLFYGIGNFDPKKKSTFLPLNIIG